MKDHENVFVIGDMRFSWNGGILHDPFFDEENPDAGATHDDFWRYYLSTEPLKELIEGCYNEVAQECSKLGWILEIHGSNVAAWIMHQLATNSGVTEDGSMYILPPESTITTSLESEKAQDE